MTGAKFSKWKRWHKRLFGTKCLLRLAYQPWSWRLWITELLAEKVMNAEDAVQMAEVLQYKQLHQLFSPRQLSYPRERSQRPIFKGPQLQVSHIRVHHHWSCDTPGSNWQLSTLVSPCHLLCQFQACPISVLLAWINKMSLRDSRGSNAQAASIRTLIWAH